MNSFVTPILEKLSGLCQEWLVGLLLFLYINNVASQSISGTPWFGSVGLGRFDTDTQKKFKRKDWQQYSNIKAHVNFKKTSKTVMSTHILLKSR